MNESENKLTQALQQAVAAQQQGQFVEALASYDRAIQIKPDCAEAFCNRGIVLRKLNRLQEALLSYELALKIDPNMPDVHNNRGNVLKQLGHSGKALASYSQAIKLKPDFIDAYLNRAALLKELKRFDTALADYDFVIKLRPDNAVTYTARGVLLKEIKRLKEALDDFNQAIFLDANNAAYYTNRGAVFREMKRFDEALESYATALVLKPDFADAYSNRGNALVEMDRLEEALADHNHSISLKPNNAGFYYNRGVAHYELGHLNAALADYEKTLVLNPNYKTAHWNEGITRLLLGDFYLGWKKYESRWHRDDSQPRKFAQPLWLGKESLKGKTILLYGEQGFGDAIQFCRYVKRVADEGAQVILEIREPLKNLMRSLTGVAQIVIRGESFPAFDYQCPLLSLPLAFNTRLETIPAEIPYLFADAQKVYDWSVKLGEKSKLRIGLAWSGSPTHKNNHHRSLRLKQFLEVMPTEVQLYSLQKEVREQDSFLLKNEARIEHFGEEITDFSDTAALIEQMDLIISVDTSVAHLAGALGKPTWVLLPEIPDWRWLVDREDSPWYPTMRLFRQDQRNQWGPVLSRITSRVTDVLRGGFHV